MQKILLKGVLVAGAFGAVLAGCSDDDDDGGPIVNPTATAVTTATASGTATASPTATATGPNQLAVALYSATTGSTEQRLVVFNASAPARVLRSLTVSGLATGERLLGIDFRPANRRLYALGSAQRLYTLNTSTGAATLVGSGFATPGLTGRDFGFDFNPVPDRIRLVSESTLNARLNPNTGGAVDSNPNVAGIQRDPNLAYAAGDANAGRSPRVVGAAYANNVAGATTTTNFAVDRATNALVTQGTRAGTTPAVSPNTGQLFTVGSLGITLGSTVAFDIGRDDVAVLSNGNAMYLVNLSSGATTRIGDLPAVSVGNGSGGTTSGTITGLALAF